ncbi:MAG: CPBP family intramembrane glutamic endopeptidase [Bryobacteraceae bacterium]
MTKFQLLPGVPVSALMFLCPVTVATISVYRENKTAGVTELLKRSIDYKRIRTKIWYVPIILLMPGVMVLSYEWISSMEAPIPAPQFRVLPALALFAAFFIAAVCEELGWSGYVTDPMQERWGTLQASILLGLVWAAWHIVPLVQVHRSLKWIAWWCLWTVAERVLIVWLYNNTGRSVFAAAVFHATSNVSWQLFPINGSHFDPRVTGVITAFAALLVTVIWDQEH